MSVKSFFAAMTLKVKVIVICSAVAVTSAAAVAVGVAVTKEDAYRVLKVFEMTGSAVVERSGSGSLDAYVGMNLESGDTLTVSDDSTLRISMDSDKYVLLDSGTVLELTAAGTSSDSRTSINLKQGTILNEITTPLSANSSYEVATPKATMAVRGTSFTVSVTDDSEGGYIIREDTFNGMVEVTLFDAVGNPQNNKALVPEDKGVTIRTERDKKSGNPAEIDGNSRFVFEDEDGNISELDEGADPIRDIRYGMISASIRKNMLRSNDESLMVLDDNIVAKLRSGSFGDVKKKPTEETAPETKNESQTTPAETTVPMTEINGNTKVTDETKVTSISSEAVVTSVTEVAETVPTEVNSDTETTQTTAEETSSSEEETTSVSSETEESETSVSESEETTVTTLPVTIQTVPTSYTGQTGPQYTITTPANVESYEVKFYCEGELIYSENVNSGKTVVNIPDIPERTGYTAKWMCGGMEFTSQTKVVSDMTVVAVYTIKSFTLTFTADADEAYSKTITADYGTLLADMLPEVPVKTGYTGVWKIGGTVNISDRLTVTSDLNIKAVYTINTYTVTITAEGDTAYSDTQTVEHGTLLSDILPEEIPVKTGHDGVWLVNGKEYTSDYVITGTTNVTAKYTPKVYTVTFLNADGSLYDTREA
ncbi:MAG: FecR domain-containing protein, partial [Huintestinicola sp.]